MSKKSDYFTAKLPRRYKRMIALGEAAGHFDREQAKLMRIGFMHAHASEVQFKLKRNANDTQSDE